MSSFTNFLIFVLLPLTIPSIVLIIIGLVVKRKDILWGWLIAIIFTLLISFQYRYTIGQKNDCVNAYNNGVKIEDISKINSECNDMYKYLDTTKKDLVK